MILRMTDRIFLASTEDCLPLPMCSGSHSQMPTYKNDKSPVPSLAALSAVPHKGCGAHATTACCQTDGSGAMRFFVPLTAASSGRQAAVYEVHHRLHVARGS